MRAATKNDRILVESIIIESFKDNPNLNFMIRPIGNKEKMLKRIAKYAFNFAFRRDGIFITSDGKGLVICCEQPIKLDWMDYFNQFMSLLLFLHIHLHFMSRLLFYTFSYPLIVNTYKFIDVNLSQRLAVIQTQ